MRNLYVVTHTEATHHVDSLVGGWYDAALTPRGVHDAQRVAAALSERIPDEEGALLVCSDLLRTRQTAEPIADRFAVEMLLDPDLREQSYGAAEGTPRGSTPYAPPPADGDRMHHRDGIDDSETRFEWANRTYSALQKILVHGARDAVVVTHGGTATYLIAAWIGLPLEHAGYVKFTVAPGSITYLREDDFFHDRQVVALNQTSHLS
ncbi:histidine phosphatase family protein [Arthrobacter pityocampae]|uniref:Histidine phosphatase family protein n=1 Tax=Arthrobacter pityocampae TaxID=547334 RepID=A0A2S5IVW0_9MICC|nr:histidine phosphatase family protein [Arthrobacter pityocampae]PPB48684.1 histidine phosphatase family protein [Arthrobacter pityocampae]